MQKIRVVARPGTKHRGFLFIGGRAFACALGPGGIRADKREGDGVTPAGRWRPLRVWYRAEAGRPATRLPLRRITRDAGWCDAPEDRNYNRPVTLPYRASHETMHRADHLYDRVIEIDHNARPRIARRGSAVFVHLARPGYAPTAGCVALSRRDMALLLSVLGTGTRFVIG